MSAETDEYADALTAAAVASVRLGVAVAEWQNSLDRLASATRALRTATEGARQTARRKADAVMEEVRP